MRVLLIHQIFNSPEEPGGTRHYELARYCVKNGHPFTVVASDTNFLLGRRIVDERRLFTEQNDSGVRVLRAYTCASLHRSFLRRVISFLSFMLTSIIVGFKAGPIDLVMGTSPPIFQAVSAWIVALVRRRPFLLEIRDLWPEFAISIGVLRSPLLIALSRWLERFLYAVATHILVNSPAYRDYLIDRGIAVDKITVIPNGVDPYMFNARTTGDRFRKEWALDSQFVVMYAGALGLANDIPTILRAADRLRDKANICFLLVGGGKECDNLKAMAEQLRLRNVTFIDARPKSEMQEVLAASDTCIATLKDIPMFRTTYPNKVFDYMAAARPTILAIDGVIREVVEAAGGGIFVPPGNDIALANAVQRLYENPQRARSMGLSARSYVEKNFNRHRQAARFLELLQRLVVGQMKGKFYRRFGKRLLDLSLTLLLLIFFSPLLITLSLLVRIKLGSPVLFRQQRPGLYGKLFSLCKLRTMTNAKDNGGGLLPDADRLTAFGKFLRSTSLDELPGLFNVLQGDMSLVGPRPLFERYTSYYREDEKIRHTVRPGITGWAQVKGRNLLSWNDRLALDIWYVNNCSLRLDIRILFMTLASVLKRDGVIVDPRSSMPDLDEERGALKDRKSDVRG